MEEYNQLTKGLRNPHSSGELEISKTKALEWGLDFIYITPPQLSLVYEQYAIIKLKPTINSNFKVIPRVNPPPLPTCFSSKRLRDGEEKIN